jgi:hypothetical protein
MKSLRGAGAPLRAALRAGPARRLARRRGLLCAENVQFYRIGGRMRPERGRPAIGGVPARSVRGRERGSAGHAMRWVRRVPPRPALTLRSRIAARAALPIADFAAWTIPPTS